MNLLFIKNLNYIFILYIFQLIFDHDYLIDVVEITYIVFRSQTKFQVPADYRYQDRNQEILPRKGGD